MQMLVPLIFVFFLIPGVVHGYVAGTVKTHRDIVDGMSDAMRTMAYYLVMAFFAAQFIAAFSSSNVGLLIALKGANFLRDLGLPAQATVVGIILLSAVVNLFVGSASAKWAVLSVIFVPMLMSLGISPELTQAAYRVGDSVTNIVTPLMPYFPLVVVFCQRYTKNAGIGTVLSLMIPYAVTLLITWTIFLIGYWLLGIPLGLQAEIHLPRGLIAPWKRHRPYPRRCPCLPGAGRHAGSRRRRRRRSRPGPSTRSTRATCRTTTARPFWSSATTTTTRWRSRSRWATQTASTRGRQTAANPTVFEPGRQRNVCLIVLPADYEGNLRWSVTVGENTEKTTERGGIDTLYLIENISMAYRRAKQVDTATAEQGVCIAPEPASTRSQP